MKVIGNDSQVVVVLLESPRVFLLVVVADAEHQMRFSEVRLQLERPFEISHRTVGVSTDLLLDATTKESDAARALRRVIADTTGCGRVRQTTPRNGQECPASYDQRQAPAAKSLSEREPQLGV